MDDQYTISDLVELGLIEDDDGEWAEEPAENDSLPN